MNQPTQTSIDQLLQEKRDAILTIAAQHGAKNVRVFGSVVRGEATAVALEGPTLNVVEP